MEIQARQTELSETAELCTRVMQKLPRVHSVRWRVKDAEHLLEKIIRKRAAGGDNNKYPAIGLDNYHEIVTDLVGLRALHLFKDECFEIHAALCDSFALLEGEDPVAYVRVGDPPELVARFQEAGLRVQQHAAGYRSVHYVFVSRPLQRRALMATSNSPTCGQSNSPGQDGADYGFSDRVGVARDVRGD